MSRLHHYFSVIRNQLVLSGFFVITITLVGVAESLGVGSLLPIADILQDQEKVLHYMTRVEEMTGIVLDPQRFVNLLFGGIIFFFITAGLMQMLS